MLCPRIYTIVQVSNDISKCPKDTVSTSELSIRIKSYLFERKSINELENAKNVRLLNLMQNAYVMQKELENFFFKTQS